MGVGLEDASFLSHLEDSFRKGSKERLFLLTYLSGGEQLYRIALTDREVESWSATLPFDLAALLLQMQSREQEIAVFQGLELGEHLNLDSQVVIEVIQAPRKVVILGAGHVGAALSRFTALLGYEVLLIDDRQEFLFSGKLKGLRITRLLSSFETVGEQVQVNGNTAVIIVTRGHYYDEVCLQQFIGLPAAYIGMIGSKRRVLGILQRLRNSGISDNLLQKVFAPIGLRIGAKTPEEIAIAILGQVIGVFNHKGER